jgi:site-specific recombinase XerD
VYDEITVDNVMGFCFWLAKERERATLNVYLSGVWRFCRWLKRAKKLDVLVYTDIQERLEDMRGGRAPDDLPKIPLESDVKLLVGAAVAAYKPKDTKRRQLMELRDIAIFHTLRASGCRVSEVADLRRNDLDYEGHGAIVTGKGRKQRMVFLDDAAWQAIVTYLTARDATGVGGELDEPVFCRYDRRSWGKVLPISSDVIRALINKLEKAGACQYHHWPHQMRHRFGTFALRQTHDLAAVQDLMGHSSPTTTRRYAQLDNEARSLAYKKISL